MLLYSPQPWCVRTSCLFAFITARRLVSLLRYLFLAMAPCRRAIDGASILYHIIVRQRPYISGRILLDLTYHKVGRLFASMVMERKCYSCRVTCASFFSLYPSECWLPEWSGPLENYFIPYSPWNGIFAFEVKQCRTAGLKRIRSRVNEGCNQRYIVELSCGKGGKTHSSDRNLASFSFALSGHVFCGLVSDWSVYHTWWTNGGWGSGLHYKRGCYWTRQRVQIEMGCEGKK